MAKKPLTNKERILDIVKKYGPITRREILWRLASRIGLHKSADFGVWDRFEVVPYFDSLVKEGKIRQAGQADRNWLFQAAD